jgi:Na+/H+ antiporter NhaD/arsenite permease-like protein
MKSNIVQWVILVLLAIVLFTFVDPFMYWMPTMIEMMVLTVVAALLAVMAGFVIAENGGDEREVLHRMHAGRSAFLAGITVLTFALLYQGFTHSIDPWVPLALFAMVFAKLITRWISERSN